jgi:outer membrane protein assembly factor BamB
MLRLSWKYSLIAAGIPLFVTLLLIGLATWWLLLPTPIEGIIRVPGADETPPDLLSEAGNPVLQGELITGEGEPSDITAAWPQFRGEDRTNIARDTPPLARDWPAAGPPALWSVRMGEGHAGPVVRHGRVYVIDYDREAEADVLRCLSLDDGRDIWQYRYPVSIKRNHGMSRTVPAVTDRFVVALGPKGHVTCCDAITGELQWSIDLVGEYASEIPPWYAGQCPMIDGDRVILAPAGDEVLMMAVDIATGETIWQTPNTPGWNMTHSSVMPMQLDERLTYVYCGSGGVVGVDAADGRLLWQTDQWTVRIAMVPSPVDIGMGRLFLSGGYGAGSMMLRIDRGENDAYVAQPVFRLDAQTYGAAQHTPVLYRDHLFGVRPSGELICLDLDGNVRWTSGMQARFGLGPFLIADDLIFVMDDHGQLTMAAADPGEYRPLASADVLDGHDAWGPMAIVEGRLLLRDLTTLKCLDLAAR